MRGPTSKGKGRKERGGERMGRDGKKGKGWDEGGEGMGGRISK